jgi:hypothetical protein
MTPAALDLKRSADIETIRRIDEWPAVQRLRRRTVYLTQKSRRYRARKKQQQNQHDAGTGT